MRVLVLTIEGFRFYNPLNAELNPISHLLTLLGAHHIFHVSGLRVKYSFRGPWNTRRKLGSSSRECASVFSVAPVSCGKRDGRTDMTKLIAQILRLLNVTAPKNVANHKWSFSPSLTLNYLMAVRLLCNSMHIIKLGESNGRLPPKNLPRMQCARTKPVTWLGSGSFQRGL